MTIILGQRVDHINIYRDGEDLVAYLCAAREPGSGGVRLESLRFPDPEDFKGLHDIKRELSVHGVPIYWIY